MECEENNENKNKKDVDYVANVASNGVKQGKIPNFPIIYKTDDKSTYMQLCGKMVAEYNPYHNYEKRGSKLIDKTMADSMIVQLSMAQLYLSLPIMFVSVTGIQKAC